MPLPKFDTGKIYLVKGSTLNAIKRELRTNRPCCIGGGGLSVFSQTDDGIFIKGEAAGRGGGISGDIDLPAIQDEKIYFLTKLVLDKLFAAARRNLTKIVTNTGLDVQYTDAGAILSSPLAPLAPS